MHFMSPISAVSMFHTLDSCEQFHHDANNSCLFYFFPGRFFFKLLLLFVCLLHHNGEKEAGCQLEKKWAGNKQCSFE